ncbi:MAG: 16S rRNA (guanine(527)-N(7))-methyltransferase RsmG [Bacteroidota bacterium]
MESKVWFKTACKQNGVELTDEQLEKIKSYAKLLLEWNKQVNLISRKDEGNLWSSHLLHSVSVLFKLNIPPRGSVLDLGTGGGLPGIPLKILLPGISLTLLDSTQKKIKVVQNILEVLSLKSTIAVWGRAEEISKQPVHQKHYDMIVARGVGSLGDLARWSWPLLKEGRGQGGEQPKRQIHAQGADRIDVETPALIAWKGGDLSQEIRSVAHNKCVRSIRIIDLTLKGSIQFEQSDKKIVLVNF